MRPYSYVVYITVLAYFLMRSYRYIVFITILVIVL
jgi:hypothetical protein